MSDHNDAFDPTAPEGDTGGKSAYMSKKDIRNILVVLVVLMALAFPIYQMMAKDSEKSRCILNMKSIADAFGEYAAEHDDRFPPLFAAGPAGEPMLQNDGAPFVWASDVSAFMNPRASFECPSATSKESAIVESQRGVTEEEKEKHLPAAKQMRLSYGFYAPYAGFLRSEIDSPGQTVVVAETSNLGSESSYDPLPFKDAAGAVLPYDAFAIGWNDGNLFATPKSQKVTRLAIRDTSDGTFTPGKIARHDKYIHALTADGSLMVLKPTAGNLSRGAGTVRPPWAIPATGYVH